MHSNRFRPGRRRHIGPRRISKGLAGPQNRLFADNTRTLDFLELTIAIGNLPMAGGELHGHTSFVSDLNGVGPPV